MIQEDVGFYCLARKGLTAATITAGAGNDGVAVNGDIIDRTTVGYAKSAFVVVHGVTTLASSETLTCAVTIQHGDASNLSDAATLHTFAAASVGLTGVQTAAAWQRKVDFDLTNAKRYVRAVVTTNLSASGTDTSAASACWVFGGLSGELPQS